MAFIDTIDDHEIDAEVRAMYERSFSGSIWIVPSWEKRVTEIGIWPIV